MHLPTPAQIEALHRKYASSPQVFATVYQHCQIIADIAGQLIAAAAAAGRLLPVNAGLVRVGALLHDIGAYEVTDAAGHDRPDRPYITHGVRGEAILRQENLPEALCQIASHHTGVGITRQQIIAQKLPLPPADYLATTNEEALIMLADKFHSKSNPPHFNAPETYRQHVSQFGAENAVKFDQLITRFGMPNLELLSQKYGHPII
jgi:uncharacterized protein